jgi:hypothetical protein
MKKVYCGIFTTAFVFGTLFAQERKPEQAPAMPKPAFGPELAKLSLLVGEFNTEMTIQLNPMAPKGSTGKGHSKMKWALDSMYIAIEEASENPFFGNYKGMGFLTYDKTEKKYFLAMFNNFGDHPSYKGNFAGDTLVLEGEIPLPQGSFKQQVRWYPERKMVKLQVLNDIGQGFTPVIEQTYLPVEKSSKSTKK